ncbi:hypothetical protein IWX48DRAFT_227748, partial [Phyllosticta citricarpa]
CLYFAGRSLCNTAVDYRELFQRASPRLQPKWLRLDTILPSRRRAIVCCKHRHCQQAFRQIQLHRSQPTKPLPESTNRQPHLRRPAGIERSRLTRQRPHAHGRPRHGRCLHLCQHADHLRLGVRRGAGHDDVAGTRSLADLRFRAATAVAMGDYNHHWRQHRGAALRQFPDPAAQTRQRAVAELGRYVGGCERGGQENGCCQA